MNVVAYRFIIRSMNSYIPQTSKCFSNVNVRWVFFDMK